MGRTCYTPVLAASLAFSLFGQQTKPTTTPSPEDLTAPLVRSQRQVVLAPTVVVGRDGSFVDDLKPSEFRLFDNGTEQKEVTVDATTIPISMVVAIQANNRMTGVLPKLKRIGPLIEQQLLGENGEAALVAFDGRIRTIQDFTHDGTAFNRALEKLNAGSSTSRMVDAILESTRMLNRRPKENRKIILLISEVRDGGSAATTREVLTNAEFGNVTIYNISVSRLVTEFTGERVPPRQSAIPPAASMGTLPGPAAPTPLAIDQIKGTPGTGTSVDFVPLVKDILIGVQKVFVDSPADVFTTYTGGRKFDFIKERGLEEAFSRLSGELHREYMLSYSPENKEGGYHELRVEVRRAGLSVRTRPGYWTAGEVPVR